MAHWHDHNPWADRVVYVPDLLELAQACWGGDDPIEAAMQVKRWLSTEAGPKVDGYVLPSPSGQHSIGIRFGKDGDYFSPQANYARAQLLIEKYSNPGAP